MSGPDWGWGQWVGAAMGYLAIGMVLARLVWARERRRYTPIARYSSTFMALVWLGWPVAAVLFGIGFIVRWVIMGGDRA